MSNSGKMIVAAALGECVHVAGLMNFLRIAERANWQTKFLGPAVSVEEVIRAAYEEEADLVAVSYRLTPATGERLLGEFAESASELHDQGVRFAFGGTPPVVERAQSLGFFERTFEGGEPAESVLAYLKGEQDTLETEIAYPQNTIDRINWKQPYPLLRHHFGLPRLDSTQKGIGKISAAGALDVISLGIDQDAQENFFNPEKQNPRRTGAGGAPVRTVEDYRNLYSATRQGNFPLLRTYSGTDDFIELAEIYIETIRNAWCAIPLFWFNQMDGRGPWDLTGSIREHQKVMSWYGQRNIPVELNEPHHWGMRDAPDVIFVVSAYLSAYNAKSFGVKDYIAQMMFNSPPGTSDAMDLAKMHAVLEMIKPLVNEDFHIWRQTRTGLLSYPQDLNSAKAHLVASIYLQMALHPHIVHIVGHTEAVHAARPEEVIEASQLARRSIDNAMNGQPDMLADSQIQERSQILIEEAKFTLDAILDLSLPEDGDPFINPEVLSSAVQTGILDAPHLRNNPFACGEIQTRIIDGACLAIDDSDNPMSEERRINQLKIFNK